MRNEKAIRLLMNGYWSSSGWKNPSFSKSDKEFLIQSGYLKERVRLTHKDCLAWAFEVRSQVTRERVSRAFLYSLTTRKLEYRSALGSYAHLQHMPAHDFERADRFVTEFCKTCGYETEAGRQIDFGVLNFERHKWGGVRHDALEYMAYDLECLSKLEDVSPTDEDLDTLVLILKLADDRSNTGKNVTHLKKGIGKILKSNDSERDELCQILAFAGILQPQDCPSFADSYIPWNRRGDGRPKSDQKFPLGWWGGHGYRIKAVEYWFPRVAARI